MINAAIAFTGADLALVTSYNASRPQDPNYWTDPATDGIRSRIKRHYATQQAFRCCYCNRELLTRHGRVWDCEHVVPRSTHPQFLFHPINLVVSCVDCNNIKSNQQTLVRPRRVTLPTTSADYLIIHAHFDAFDDHLAILFGRFYLAKTDKGAATIITCGLLRYSYELLGWNELVATLGSTESFFQQLMDATTEQERQLAKLQLLAICQLTALRPP